MKVGQKFIYSKKGYDHVPQMDRFIGQVVTIKKIVDKGTDWERVTILEDMHNFYFDIDVLVPIVTSIR